MSAAILPMQAAGHAGGFMQSNPGALTPVDELSVVLPKPRRSIQIPALAPQLQSQPSTTIQPLPTLHITASPTTQNFSRSKDISSTNTLQQQQFLLTARPVSIAQQPRNSLQLPQQPNHSSNHNRSSVACSIATVRPTSQVLRTPNLVSSRASSTSSATLVESPATITPTMASQYLPHQMYSSHQQPMNNMSRRTPSNASNTSSQHESIRRSSSSRSSNVSSYVALLRKQKATVWCDRSQAEDPRIMAAQRLAKERAERAVSALPSQSSQAHHLQGSNGSNGAGGPGGVKRTPPSSTTSSFTTGVARKIRHHGAQKATTYAGGNMAGAGVPLRLSATEIDDEEEEEGAGERLGSLRNPLDDMDFDTQFYGGAGPVRGLHTRTASGQSRGNYTGNTPAKLDFGSITTPPSSSPPDEDMTPGNSRGKDYFSAKKGSIASNATAASAAEDAQAVAKAKDDELRRRGSVDERAMTLSAGRLFVANPDMDSD